MHSVLTTSLIISCTYVIVDAAKVIKWLSEEPTEIKHESEVLKPQFEENTNYELKEDGFKEDFLEDTNKINQPDADVAAEEIELNNAENLENLVTQNERDAAIKINKSQPKCLTDFVGTLIYDLMQSENGRIVVSTFLNAMTHTMSNSVSSSMYLHISRQLKNLLKDSEGSQSISIISNTFAKLFTDERAFKNLNIVVENFKMTCIRAETTLLIENINKLTTSLSVRPRSRRIVRAFGDGILSVLKLPDPKNTIIKGFQDLHSYTWPNVNTSPNSVVS